MKVVVTGAAGLVGQNLVPMLLAQGYRITAIDRNPNINLLKRLHPKVNCIQTDVSYPGKWEREFKDADCVIELHAQIAAQTAKPFERSNIEGVSNVLEICKKYRIKNLIHISSSVVISVAKDEYTRTKRIGEQMVHKSKVPHTILRPPLMFGCFDAKHLGWITRFMEKTPIVPVPGSGKYIRQPLFVNDLCKVIVELTKRKPQNKIYNIIGLEKIPYIDLLKIIAKTRGWHRLFVPLPLWLFGFLLRVYSFVFRKTVFTPDQMRALVAGDEFPVENWCEEFGVRYTPFKEAIWKTWHSPCSKYAKEMVSPH
ncbi:MAG: NAD-dependent epimerase/dehydratase family protein [Candidatus Woesearchaeota archaeon]